MQNKRSNIQLKSLTMNMCTSAFALVFSIVGFPQLSMANTTASASSRLGASNQSDASTGAAGQAVQASSSQSGGYSGTAIGQSAGTAKAAEGSLRAYASASGTTVAPSPSGSVSVAGYGRASWNDYLTIGAGSGLLGHSGYITAELTLSGIVGGDIGGAPAAYGGEIGRYASLQMIGTGMTGYCGGWNYCAATYIDSLGAGNYSNWNLPSLITLNIPVIFGSQKGLSYTLDVSASAFVLTRPGHLGSWADSAVDYTLSWGGITGVFDASGNSVSNFTATSTSGFDYYRNAAPAVPEPETYAMLLAGLGLLGFTTRRRKDFAA